MSHMYKIHGVQKRWHRRAIKMAYSGMTHCWGTWISQLPDLRHPELRLESQRADTPVPGGENSHKQLVTK